MPVPPPVPPPAPFPAGAKFAVVNLQAIASNSAEGKALAARVQTLMQKKQTEGAEKSKQLQANQQKLQQSGSLMNEQARAALEKEIERQQVEGQRFQQDAQAEVNELTQELQGEFQKRAVPAPPAARAGKAAPGALERAGRGCDLGGARDRPDGRSDQKARWRRRSLALPSSNVINIPILLDRLCYRYPSMLVDAISEHDAGRRLMAVKNVTVNEEFFQGHFPGAPVMPAVLMLESFSQVAAILLLQREDASPNARVYLRGVNDAKFRRQVVPGDRLRLEISVGKRRASLARAKAVAYVGDQLVAEASCCSA